MLSPLQDQKLVEEDLISTAAGMWASTYILLPIGVFLTYKASTDSVILNIDTYLVFFRKIKGLPVQDNNCRDPP